MVKLPLLGCIYVTWFRIIVCKIIDYDIVLHTYMTVHIFTYVIFIDIHMCICIYSIPFHCGFNLLYLFSSTMSRLC